MCPTITIILRIIHYQYGFVWNQGTPIFAGSSLVSLSKNPIKRGNAPFLNKPISLSLSSLSASLQSLLSWSCFSFFEHYPSFKLQLIIVIITFFSLVFLLLWTIFHSFSCLLLLYYDDDCYPCYTDCYSDYVLFDNDDDDDDDDD